MQRWFDIRMFEIFWPTYIRTFGKKNLFTDASLKAPLKSVEFIYCRKIDNDRHLDIYA